MRSTRACAHWHVALMAPLRRPSVTLACAAVCAGTVSSPHGPHAPPSVLRGRLLAARPPMHMLPLCRRRSRRRLCVSFVYCFSAQRRMHPLSRDCSARPGTRPTSFVNAGVARRTRAEARAAEQAAAPEPQPRRRSSARRYSDATQVWLERRDAECNSRADTVDLDLNLYTAAELSREGAAAASSCQLLSSQDTAT